MFAFILGQSVSIFHPSVREIYILWWTRENFIPFGRYTERYKCFYWASENLSKPNFCETEENCRQEYWWEFQVCQIIFPFKLYLKLFQFFCTSWEVWKLNFSSVEVSWEKDSWEGILIENIWQVNCRRLRYIPYKFFNLNLFYCFCSVVHRFNNFMSGRLINI